MYWLLKLDDIHNALIGAITTCIVLVGVLLVIMFFLIMEAEDIPKKLKNTALFSFWILWPLVLGKTLLPSTKQMVLIQITPPVLNAVANNKEVQKLPDNILKLLNTQLEEWTKDIGEKK